MNVKNHWPYGWNNHCFHQGKTEAVSRKCSVDKLFFKVSQNSEENTWTCNFIKKEIVAQVSVSEFSKTFKDSIFTEHLMETASDKSND